ncbi:MAG TPA: aspartate/glutamate racemase family protein, partial [Armatimonadota bacterium]|nr:aspartate/glutamate racemase family protein [Armatimonadota bacterium]
PEFVPLVEAGITSGPEAQAAVERHATPIRALGIDTVVLGCTHYPYLSEVLHQAFGDGVTLVDPAEELAIALKQLLDARNLHRDTTEMPTHRYLVSGEPEPFLETARRLLGREITVEKVDIFNGES